MECKVFVPFGALGIGMTRKEFEQGLKFKPDIICSDAGSTDSGPYYLGTGTSKYARESVKEDLRLMIKGGQQLSIPIAIGSAGTCGVDRSVDEVEAICLEICEEEKIEAKIAKIYTEQAPSRMKEAYRAGRIHPLEGAPTIDETTFDDCSHIVALAGVEPFIEALNNGSDIIISGRATDTAVIASLPILRGCAIASSWHGAKIAECGPICTTTPMDGGVLLTVGKDYFTIQPTIEESQCTVWTVSSHMLYENADPYRLIEPSIVLNTKEATYTQVDDRTVKVSGANYTNKPNTLKLEGAGPVGYQTISLVGIKDREILTDPETWIEGLSEKVVAEIEELGIPKEAYDFDLKPYGWNAVSPAEVPGGYIPNELGILLVVTATSQALATKIAKFFNPKLLHFSLDKYEPMPSFAFPFSPAEIQRGPVYEFKLHHVLEVEDFFDYIRVEYREVNQGKRRDSLADHR